MNTYKDLILADAPQFYFTMDDPDMAGGLPRDVGSHTFQPQNATGITSGQAGLIPGDPATSIQLDGSQRPYIEGQGMDALLGRENAGDEFAFECILRPTDMTDYRYLITKGETMGDNGAYMVQLNANGTVRFTFYGGSGSNESIVTPPDGALITDNAVNYLAVLHRYGTPLSTVILINGQTYRAIKGDITWSGGGGTPGAGVPTTTADAADIGLFFRSPNSDHPFIGFAQHYAVYRHLPLLANFQQRADWALNGDPQTYPYHVTGVLTENGTPQGGRTVFVLDYASGAKLNSGVTDAGGNYDIGLDSNADVLLVGKGGSGILPYASGPITPSAV